MPGCTKNVAYRLRQ